MATDPAAVSRRQRLNVLQRHYGRDAEQVVELRRQVAADALARHVARIVESAPPLNDEQRRRIVGLLAPAVAPSATTAA